MEGFVANGETSYFYINIAHVSRPEGFPPWIRIASFDRNSPDETTCVPERQDFHDLQKTVQVHVNIHPEARDTIISVFELIDS